MKHKIKSWSLLFLMGLGLLTLVFPSVVFAQSPIAQFTASATQGSAPLTVQFTDKSVTAGPTSYKWEFRNDGIITSSSTAKNPSITFTRVGNKTVKLTVTNASGSDSEIKRNYIKVSPPSISVTSPNGGESLVSGSTRAITWISSGNVGSYVKIEVLRAEAVAQILSASTPNDGSFSWPVAPGLRTGTAYKIRISSTTNSAISDISNNYFTIISGTTTPSIIVTSPNGGETWQQGTSHAVTWSYTGNPGSTVKIVLLKSGTGTQVGTIATSAPIGSNGKGSYTWPIYSSGSTGTDYKVSIQSISQPTIKDVSNSYLTIISGTSTPVIKSLPTDETIGAESNPTGNPIGGGKGYNDIILPGDPNIKYIVTNYAEFASALTKTYKKGDIIYVPETATINMTGHPGVVIPRNVTIASNRGSNGSPGGRFFWSSSPSDSSHGYQTGTMFYITTDNVRITGLRLEGPHMTTDPSVGENSKQRSAMDLRNGKGLEVDNCEMYGWAYAAVDIETSTGQDALYALGLNSAEIGSAIANIHHNYIHHCQMDGLGYGVIVCRGTALVKANLFDYTRHAIAASGNQYEGYEASYNIHLGHGYKGSVFDMHGWDVGAVERIAGTLVKIHHNTLNYTVDHSIGIRGTPTDQEYIYNNRMQWFVSGGKNYPPVYQSCGSTTNVTMTNNMIGGVLYPGNVIRYYSSC